MINNVTLVGRLTKDPDLRYTGQNTAVASFTIAVNRRFKTAAGQREADFINCVIWRKPAENLSNWVKKGNLIGVVGALQTRSYENQQGQRVYVTEVVVEQFQVLESRMTREDFPSSSRGGEKTPVLGTINSEVAEDPFSVGSPMEILDEELPF